MIPGLRPEAEQEIAFTTEAFNGVFGEVGIDSSGTVDFIRKAVEFANDGMWGTLGCSLIVHPEVDEGPGGRSARSSRRSPTCGTAPSRVNHWSAIGFLLGTTPWGAYPGHTIDDVQSGIGFVHNSLMLAEADIEKTVVRGPFRMPVKPTWFAHQQDRAQVRRAVRQAHGQALVGQAARARHDRHARLGEN